MSIKYRSYWLSGDYLDPIIISLKFTFWPHLSFMIEFHLQKCWKGKKNHFFKYQVRYLVSRNADIWIMDNISTHCPEDEVKKWAACRAQAEKWWAYSWVPITNQVTAQLCQATPFPVVGISTGSVALNGQKSYRTAVYCKTISIVKWKPAAPALKHVASKLSIWLSMWFPLLRPFLLNRYSGKWCSCTLNFPLRMTLSSEMFPPPYY